jgi:hypothetical protein
VLACVTPRIASANCAAGDPDGSKTAAARVSAEQTCASMNPAMGCTTAPNHCAYVSCIGGAANGLVTAGTFPKTCKGTVKKCAARSACGKPGFVTCCTTNKKGATSCKIKNSATACSGTVGTCGTCCGDGPPVGSGPTSPAG